MLGSTIQVGAAIFDAHSARAGASERAQSPVTRRLAERYVVRCRLDDHWL